MFAGMGCVHCKRSPFKPGGLKSRSSPERKTYSWDKRGNVNAEDYTVENAKGATIVKYPGRVRGQQFIIQNCEDSTIYVLYHVNTVTIDDCINCNIILGPTKGSVFLRKCRDCRLATACQQLRARDCCHLDLFLSCATQPSIESCSEMRFGCLCLTYNQLEADLKSANLSAFNNSWSEIHDFTPSETGCNWSLLPQDVRMEDFLPVPSTEHMEHSPSMQLSLDPSDSDVPRTAGPHCQLGKQRCLVVFFSDGQSSQRALYFVHEMEKTPNILVQTKEVTLDKATAEKIFRTSSYNAVIGSGPVIALEYTGDACLSSCQEVAKAIATETGSTGLVYVSSQANSALRQIEAVFGAATSRGIQ
ncbi:protein XRP2-like isoform X1 [Ixodes scapularis]|uniref:protein XRP2-like isoform X1 n=1 Tax=Ixodes scapularis TaxID=6945 RepID=UPI001A9DE94A|nr:protein XRP2-like isoform X1 [Ixodes scapularis]